MLYEQITPVINSNLYQESTESTISILKIVQVDNNYFDSNAHLIENYSLEDLDVIVNQNISIPLQEQQVPINITHENDKNCDRVLEIANNTKDLLSKFIHFLKNSYQ